MANPQQRRSPSQWPTSRPLANPQRWVQRINTTAFRCLNVMVNKIEHAQDTKKDNGRSQFEYGAGQKLEMKSKAEQMARYQQLMSEVTEC